jgi:WhiB family transcriptional regulator, redox-sensing transcriptional regulator
VTTGISRDPASHGRDLRPVPAAAYDRASWRESAACRQAADPELFFPIGTASIAVVETQRAKAICDSCQVRRPCLTFALATRQEFGIWGGYDETERRLLHRQQRGSGTAVGR